MSKWKPIPVASQTEIPVQDKLHYTAPKAFFVPLKPEEKLSMGPTRAKCVSPDCEFKD